MDTILADSDILESSNWVHVKIYRDPRLDSSWKPKLDWYHSVLLRVIKPIVEKFSEIRVVFFSIYGPESYDCDDEEYEKKLSNQNIKTVYIHLRLSTKTGDKIRIRDEVVHFIESNRKLVWDYEILNTFKGIGPGIIDRYGSKDTHQTLLFIRYWDAACRYILSILTMPGNWKKDVDVWGTPNLVNNSLGAILRSNAFICDQCGSPFYQLIDVVDLSKPLQITSLPVFYHRCPICGNEAVSCSNM